MLLISCELYLVNCLAFQVYYYVEDCVTYDEAISASKTLFFKTLNVVFSRHIVATPRQQYDKSIYDFL